MHNFVGDYRGLSLLQLRNLKHVGLEIVVSMQMQVTILDAALHHVLAQMLVEFELIANDQTQSNQVVVFKNAQHEFNELKRDLVKFDLSFFFELQINNFFRLLTDVQ